MAAEFNPYQSPAASSLNPPVVDRAAAGSLHRFQSGTFRARVCIGAFGFMILVNLTALVALAGQWNLLQAARSGRIVPQFEADANDLRVNTLGFIEIAMNVLLAIVFLCWIHRANKNLPALGERDLQFTPGSAVGWWFVPFANLVRPYQIASEIWRASDPATIGQGGFAWKTAHGSMLIGAWWLMFLLARVASRLLTVGAKSIKSVDDALNLTVGAIAVEFICIAAAALAILVVYRTNDRQEFKYDLLLRAASAPPDPPMMLNPDHFAPTEPA